MKRDVENVPSPLDHSTSKCIALSQKAVGNGSTTPVKLDDGDYADWVIVWIHCLREYPDQPYRRLLDVLQKMPNIVDSLGLTVDELPDCTTMCTRKQELEMAVWPLLLRLSADLHETGDVQAIDATAFDRHSASRHYVNRVDYTFQAVKTTALVDCKMSTILDIHCSMKQPHDTQIGRQVLFRNITHLQTITADKGYGWDDFRQQLRNEDVRPVIKHRECYPLDMAHNARHDPEIYH